MVSYRRSFNLRYIDREFSKVGTKAKRKIEIFLIHRKGPTGVASAAWYIASVLAGEKVPLEKIAEVAEVPEETVRNRCDDLVNHLLFIITL